VRNESCRAHPSIRIVRGAVDLAIFGRLSGSRCADLNQVMRRVWKKVLGLRLYRVLSHAFTLLCFSKL